MTDAATTEVERLRAALAAEHAALYAYGRLGVYLEKEIQPVAHQAEAAHRARRDALIVHLAQVKAQPVQPEVAYSLPIPLTDRDSALRLAATIEDGVAATWRSALAQTAPGTAPSATPSAMASDLPSTTANATPIDDPRRLAVGGFADAAARATRWRKIAGITPLTRTFPGRPN